MNTKTRNIGLILGHPSSAEVQSVYQEITRQGNIPLILNTEDIPSRANIELHTNHRVMNISIGDNTFSLSQVAGVYWASVNSPKAITKLAHSDFLTQVVTKPSLDCACLLQLLLSMENINWINSFKAVQFHRTKPLQLLLAQSLGARIPATYIGNNRQSIDSFLKQHSQTIVKPIFAGGHTKLVSTEIKETDPEHRWATQPLTLQNYIPGSNVRSYIVGNFIASGYIEEIYLHKKPKDVTDYREADRVKLISTQIPIYLQQLSIRIMRSFHMKYTAIDWRLTPEGEYVFLEANPAPLFVNAQAHLNVDLSRAIVDQMFA